MQPFGTSKNKIWAFYFNLRSWLIESHGILAHQVEVVLALGQGRVVAVDDPGGDGLQVYRLRDDFVVFGVTLRQRFQILSRTFIKK